MRRRFAWFAMLLLCAAFGVFTTVGVAWARAVWPPSIPQWPMTIVWHGEVRNIIDHTEVGDPYAPWGGEEGPVGTLVYTAMPALERWEGPAFAYRRQDQTHDLVPSVVSRYQTGFPLLALESVRAVNTKEGTWTSGLPMPSWAPRLNPRGPLDRIPSRPLSLGFLVDAAVYGATPLILVLALRALRRWGRRRRGLCPACAYDLAGIRSGRCPECGRAQPSLNAEADEAAARATP
jgi:hypothetical protein